MTPLHATAADGEGRSPPAISIFRRLERCGGESLKEVCAAIQDEFRDDPARAREAAIPRIAHHLIGHGTQPEAAVALAKNVLGLGLGEHDRETLVWEQPQPIPSGLPAVEPFSETVLPSALRPWVIDIAERMVCPVEFPAVAAIVGLASVIGRSVGVRPKAHDDWTVVPNLWAAVIGRPGELKSPSVQEALRPLHRLEKLSLDGYREAERVFEVEREVNEISAKLRRDKLRKQLKGGADPAAVARELAAESDPEPPVCRRFIVNDSTVEKLGELLEANPRGLLVYRDELIGFLRAMDREGQEAARAFYLEAWSGTGGFTYDRIGRGTTRIEAATVSVLGCIQPGPLSEHLRGAAGGRSGDDGLVQRFQLSVWPDPVGTWKNVDRAPDRSAQHAAFELFDRLANLSPDSVEAERERSAPDGAIAFLRFDAAGQQAFDAWREMLEMRIRTDDEHPIIEAHLAKYRSLIPSLALVHHLADGNVGPVGEKAVAAAISWGEFLESHARRIYSAITGVDTTPAKALASRLRRGDVPDPFRATDIYRNGWTGLGTPEDVRRATDLLTTLGWIQDQKVPSGPKGGRPTTQFRINPLIDPASL